MSRVVHLRIFRVVKDRVVGLLFGAILAIVQFGALAHAQSPVKLTVGYGPASDFTLLFIKLKPELAKHYGKSYTLDLQQFRGSDMRFRAYLAGTLDGATASSNSIVRAASKGIGLVIVASISKESSKGFNTTYLVKDASPIKTIKDAKGKVIGINAHRSSIELWARLAVTKAGLNPDRDVRFAVVRFPLQGQALRSGEIDVGAFPQPFFAIEKQAGGVRTLFTSRDAVPFDQETQLLFFRREVLAKSPNAVRGFLADLAAVTKFYLEHSDEARRLLVKNKVVRVPERTFLAMKDYYRDPNLHVSIENLEKMQAIQIKYRYQDKPVNFKKLVDTSYLPK
jgi:ABC-type nitrate/sulfonate/bicarbonate transport system substrate-binding protein